jgi:hypothetical protein
MSGADQPGLLWRKSSACNPTECVEVAFCRDRVFVRDSKNREATVLEFTRAEWLSFIVDPSRWSLPESQPAPWGFTRTPTDDGE